ncbi:hypothetical protein ABPG72_007968 [Tetrahymena utriculariae]
MLFQNTNTAALNILKHNKQDIDQSELVRAQDTWQSSILKEKLSNLEKKLLENKDEINILKEKFEQQPSYSMIRCKYYDYLLYEQILQRQITHQKNIILFGQQNESILDLDFYPIIFSSSLKCIGDQKYNNIISILTLQHQFCVQEIRLFFYQILSNIRRHLKQFKSEASTQTELIVTFQKSENQLNSKYLSKNPNKLEYLKQIQPQNNNHNNNVFLFYYFMGQKHTYEIKELEISVEEFLEDIFQQKSELYEIILVKNINLLQTKIDSSEHMFLIELQQMQNAYNIYILPKSYQQSKILDNQQAFTKRKDKSVQSSDSEEIDDQFHQFQQKEQKISKQVDFTYFIDDQEETKDQYQYDNKKQMEIISETSSKIDEQELASQISKNQQNEKKSNSQAIQLQTENFNLSQQNKQEQIFDLSDKNEQNIQEKDANQICQSNTEKSNLVESQLSKFNESTDEQKKDFSLYQQNQASSSVQQNQETINQIHIDQLSKKDECITPFSQPLLTRNENESLVDNEKLQSLTSFEVLLSEQKSQNKQDELTSQESNYQTNKEKKQQDLADFSSDSTQK